MDVFDVEAMDKLESELDRLIERRAREAKDANAVEELWKQSKGAHQARRREANRVLWINHYATLAESLALRSAEYQRRARALERDT